MTQFKLSEDVISFVLINLFWSKRSWVHGQHVTWVHVTILSIFVWNFKNRNCKNWRNAIMVPWIVASNTVFSTNMSSHTIIAISNVNQCAQTKMKRLWVFWYQQLLIKNWSFCISQCSVNDVSFGGCREHPFGRTHILLLSLELNRHSTTQWKLQCYWFKR